MTWSQSHHKIVHSHTSIPLNTLLMANLKTFVWTIQFCKFVMLCLTCIFKIIFCIVKFWRRLRLIVNIKIILFNKTFLDSTKWVGAVPHPPVTLSMAGVKKKYERQGFHHLGVDGETDPTSRMPVFICTKDLSCTHRTHCTHLLYTWGGNKLLNPHQNHQIEKSKYFDYQFTKKDVIFKHLLQKKCVMVWSGQGSCI